MSLENSLACKAAAGGGVDGPNNLAIHRFLFVAVFKGCSPGLVWAMAFNGWSNM